MKPLAWMRRSVELNDLQRRRAADPFTAALSREIEKLTVHAEREEARWQGGLRAYATGPWLALTSVHEEAIAYVMCRQSRANLVLHLCRYTPGEPSGGGAEYNTLLCGVGTRMAKFVTPALAIVAGGST